MADSRMFPFLNKTLTVQYIRSNYFSRGPTSVDMELTNRCNLRCRMCWFHGDNGIGDRYGDSEMTTGEIMSFIDQVAGYRPHIYFGGGEPLIRDDFLTIVAHVKGRDLPVAFTTNGTLLDPEIIRKIVELEIDHINFSIDGREELHDELRGRGSFGKAVSNLQRLLEQRRAEDAKKPSITVNVTINPLVVGHLKETIRSLQDATGNQVDSFRIHHLWFISPTELQAHQAAVRKALDRSAQGAGAHRVPFVQSIDPAALADEISQLEGLDKVKFFPDLHGRRVYDFYSEGYQSKNRCGAPFCAVVVKPNGDVRFCPDEWIDDYVLGNIREDRFRAIWSSRRARHFRSVLYRKGSFPGCQRCSWMHCF